MIVFIKVGEFITLQSCLVMFFVVLAALTSIKFGLLFRVAKPLLMFLVGMSVGAYLASLINIDSAWVGALFGGIAFVLAFMFFAGSTSSSGV
jgi:hypothetical protein